MITQNLQHGVSKITRLVHSRTGRAISQVVRSNQKSKYSVRNEGKSFLSVGGHLSPHLLAIDQQEALERHAASLMIEQNGNLQEDGRALPGGREG